MLQTKAEFQEKFLSQIGTSLGQNLSEIFAKMGQVLSWAGRLEIFGC
jgi:hypothetical protein